MDRLWPGSENRDLPAFIVMISIGRTEATSALTTGSGKRLSGFALPGREVSQRPDPVLYLSNPPQAKKFAAVSSMTWPS